MQARGVLSRGDCTSVTDPQGQSLYKADGEESSSTPDFCSPFPWVELFSAHSLATRALGTDTALQR